jgi:hypothetical protein
LPRRKRDHHLYQLAKRGAEARLSDLVHEAKLLVGLFPHLRDSFDKEELPLSFLIAKGAGRVTRRSKTVRRRRRMSPAARRAVSQRMKRYWAQRRKAETKAK